MCDMIEICVVTGTKKYCTFEDKFTNFYKLLMAVNEWNNYDWHFGRIFS